MVLVGHYLPSSRRFETMKKSIIISILVVLGVFGLSGCGSKPEEYDPENRKNSTSIQTDFFKVQLFNVDCREYYDKWARVYGLTELGKKQEILVIPEDIEGFPATMIGVLGSKKYGIKSDNLKKIYIPQTIYSRMYRGLPIAAQSISCQDAVVFLTAEEINLSGIVRKDTMIIMMPDAFTRSTQGLLEDFVANIKYCSPNIIYHYNYETSPNQDIYWLDFIEKDSLYLNPESPKRKGYIFIGWYVDINCQEKWDGTYPSNGEDIVEIYAGWEEEPSL